MRLAIKGPAIRKPPAKIAKTVILAALIGAGWVMASSQWNRGEAAPLIFRCKNTSSGATWDVKVDLDRSTVDSFPAQITKTNISWRDTKQRGSYDLDRATGALTQVNASSMGGTLWFHHCDGG
jgi:hypothetical protein